MSNNPLAAIAEAEEQARQNKTEAQRKAAAAVSAAEQAGKAIVDAAAEKATEEATQMMENAKSAAAQQAKELYQTTSNKCAAIRARAEARMNEAVSLIIEEVIKSRCQL